MLIVMAKRTKPTPSDPDLRVYVKELADRRGITQAKLAELMDCEPGTLSKLLNNKMRWTSIWLKRAADALGKTVPELFISPGFGPLTAADPIQNVYIGDLMRKNIGRKLGPKDEAYRLAAKNFPAGIYWNKVADILEKHIGTEEPEKPLEHVISPEDVRYLRMLAQQDAEVIDFPGPINLVKLQITGEVQAGIWREAEEQDGRDEEEIDFPEDKRFAGFPLTALRVRGSSMDKIIPPGAVAVCVSYIELGRDPVSGEYVVVQRRKLNGLIEATIKQFMVENGRPLLFPRSHDPRFQEPLAMDGNSDDEEITVTARVIDVIRRL